MKPQKSVSTSCSQLSPGTDSGEICMRRRNRIVTANVKCSQLRFPVQRVAVSRIVRLDYVAMMLTVCLVCLYCVDGQVGIDRNSLPKDSTPPVWTGETIRTVSHLLLRRQSPSGRCSIALYRAADSNHLPICARFSTPFGHSRDADDCRLHSICCAVERVYDGQVRGTEGKAGQSDYGAIESNPIWRTRSIEKDERISGVVVVSWRR